MFNRETIRGNESAGVRRYFLAILLAGLLAALAAHAAFAQLPIQTIKQPSAPIQRVGVNAERQTLLTLRDAVALALENNRDIGIERFNTQLREQDLRAAKGAYDPSLTSSIFYDRQT